MGATNAVHVNMKKYNIPNELTHAQANKLLIDNANKCTQIKKITPTGEDNNVVAFGRYYSYAVAIKKAQVRVKVKFDQGLGMMLALLCAPFAVWFSYVLDVSDFDFSKIALPLGAFLLVWGIVWTIAYLFGNREQKAILPYIYNTLEGILEKSEKTGFTLGVYLSLAVGLIGLVLVVVSFLL